jgi:alpha-beta hydrolase superfamily lysophospholipase
LALPPSINATDGTTLHLVEWSAEGPRGTVLIVHGLGEHGDRYGHVAQWLSTRGFRVVSYDQRGHGQSQGPRGISPTPDALYEDLELVIDTVRPPNEKLIVLGHSMGGAIAARFVADQRRPIDGLILSSPALAANLSMMQKLQLYIGERTMPMIAQGNGLDPKMISHNQTVVRAYMEDPLVHDRISARLARVLIDAGEVARTKASHWQVPTLLVYAGADALVSPSGSDAFAASAPREFVESTKFDGLYHEILNETEALAAPVFARIEQWLDARFPA